MGGWVGGAMQMIVHLGGWLFTSANVERLPAAALFFIHPSETCILNILSLQCCKQICAHCNYPFHPFSHPSPYHWHCPHLLAITHCSAPLPASVSQPGPSGIPGIPGIPGFPGFKSAKIPGFLKLKSRDFSGFFVTIFWTPWNAL